MSMSEDLNRVSAAQIVNGGDAFNEYLQRKHQLEEESRRRAQFLSDDARHRAEHVQDEETAFQHAKSLQDDRYQQEIKFKQQMDKNAARLVLEKKAAEYRIPTINADGTLRTESQILADIDAKAGASARAISGRIQSLQSTLNSFSENPNMAGLQRQALRSVASDPSLMGHLPQDVAAKLKFIADTNGDLGTFLSKMRAGVLWGMNSNKYADAIEQAYMTQLGNLAAVSKDESVRKYAVATKGVLEQMKPLSDAMGKHFSDMSSAGLSDYLTSDQETSPNAPTADSKGLVLPSSGGKPVASILGPSTPAQPDNSAFPDPQTFANRDAVANLTGQISDLQQQIDQRKANLQAGGTTTYALGVPSSMPYMDPNPQSHFLPYSNADLARISTEGRNLETQLAEKKRLLASLQPSVAGSSPASPVTQSDRAQQIFGTTDFTVTPQDREDIIALGRSKGMSLQDLAYLQEVAQSPTSSRADKVGVLRKIFALRDEARANRVRQASFTDYSQPQGDNSDPSE